MADGAGVPAEKVEEAFEVLDAEAQGEIPLSEVVSPPPAFPSFPAFPAFPSLLPFPSFPPRGLE